MRRHDAASTHSLRDFGCDFGAYILSNSPFNIYSIRYSHRIYLASLYPFMRYVSTFGYAAGRADIALCAMVNPECGCNTLEGGGGGGAHGQHVIHGRRHRKRDGNTIRCYDTGRHGVGGFALCTRCSTHTHLWPYTLCHTTAIHLRHRHAHTRFVE